MRKRLIPVMLSMCIMLTDTMPAFAEYHNVNGQAGIPVTIPNEVETSYTVAADPLITLEWTEGNTYEGSYHIGATGTLRAGQYVTIRPDDEFSVSGDKGSAVGNVSQDKYYWIDKSYDVNSSGFTESFYDDALSVLETDDEKSMGKAQIEIKGDGSYTGGLSFTFSLKTN